MSQPILVGRSNSVQRNIGVEEIVRAELKQMDPLLDIRWVPNAVPTEIDGVTFEGRYALICTWPQADRRWELYNKGEIGEPFDIFGWFVEPDAEGNIHNGTRLPVDPLELLDVVKRFIAKGDNARNPWRQRMRKAIEHNERHRAKQDAEIVDETVDEIETRHRTRRQVGAHTKRTEPKPEIRIVK